jgi:hypothetical protein
MGCPMESPPNLVGRPALVAWVEFGVASVCRRPSVGGGSGVVLVPSFRNVLSRGGQNKVHGQAWPRAPQTTWVACGPRAAWRCHLPPLGLAMGRVTFHLATKVALLALVQAMSILDSMAQVSPQGMSWDVPLEVWRTLERVVEKGQCSWASAEAIARHVDLHGKPWAAETARLVEGLDRATKSWLEGQSWWRRWALERVARALQGPRTSEHSWVMQRSWSASSLTSEGLGIWRGKTPWAKWTFTTAHPNTWAGSVFGRRGDLHWTLGDHSAGWGQGLTIPRGRTFGTEWHVGDPGLPAAGRLTPSMQTGHPSTMRGLAGEWIRGHRTFGASLGPSHVAAVARFQKSVDVWLDLEGWMSKGAQRLGASGALVAGPHHIQGAAAMVMSDRTALGHASVRRAWADMWLLQATCRGRWSLSDLRAPHLTMMWSMTCRPRNGGMPFQVRCALDDRQSTLEMRLHPKPRWRLAFAASENNVQLGVRHRRDLGQVEFTVRQAEGGWGVSRHVRMTHRLEGPRRLSLGMVWMEGVGGGAMQRAILPWADRLTWMQSPSEGARVSLWARWGDVKDNRTWSMHGAWQPSQQVAFRCALRLSWEA